VVNCVPRFLRDHLLTLATLAGAVAGVSLGLGLKSMGDGLYSARQARSVLSVGTIMSLRNTYYPRYN
jgi:hypothetical protein